MALRTKVDIAVNINFFRNTNLLTQGDYYIQLKLFTQQDEVEG